MAHKASSFTDEQFDATEKALHTVHTPDERTPYGHLWDIMVEGKKEDRERAMRIISGALYEKNELLRLNGSVERFEFTKQAAHRELEMENYRLKHERPAIEIECDEDGLPEVRNLTNLLRSFADAIEEMDEKYRAAYTKKFEDVTKDYEERVSTAKHYQWKAEYELKKIQEKEMLTGEHSAIEGYLKEKARADALEARIAELEAQLAAQPTTTAEIEPVGDSVPENDEYVPEPVDLPTDVPHVHGGSGEPEPATVTAVETQAENDEICEHCIEWEKQYDDRVKLSHDLEDRIEKLEEQLRESEQLRQATSSAEDKLIQQNRDLTDENLNLKRRLSMLETLLHENGIEIPA
jgi:BMFP domain-containing protein YqiC